MNALQTSTSSRPCSSRTRAMSAATSSSDAASLRTGVPLPPSRSISSHVASIVASVWSSPSARSVLMPCAGPSGRGGQGGRMVAVVVVVVVVAVAAVVAAAAVVAVVVKVVVVAAAAVKLVAVEVVVVAAMAVAASPSPTCPAARAARHVHVGSSAAQFQRDPLADATAPAGHNANLAGEARAGGRGACERGATVTPRHGANRPSRHGGRAGDEATAEGRGERHQNQPHGRGGPPHSLQRHPARLYLQRDKKDRALAISLSRA